MIALRRTIETGVRHPIFGPVCVILLAFLMVFTVMHGAHDQIHESVGELLVCIAIVLTAVIALLGCLPHVVRLAAVLMPRPPPCRPPRASVHERSFMTASIPLRL